MGKLLGVKQTMSNMKLINDNQDYMLYSINNAEVYGINKKLYNAIDKIDDCDDEKEINSINNALSDINVNGDDKREYEVWNKDNHANMAIIYLCEKCNLKCKYCFASGEDGGFVGDTMSLETAKKTIDFMVDQYAGDENKIRLSFFGGEPLLNYEVLQNIVEYCKTYKKIKFTYNLSTNGILLDNDKIRYLANNNFSLILSLDGPQKTHEENRPKLNNEEYFDQIIDKIELLRDDGLIDRTTIRGTYTSQDLYISKITDFYNKLGITKYSLEPAFVHHQNDLSLINGDIDILKGEYGKITKQLYDNYLNGKNILFYPYKQIIDYLYHGKKKIYECSPAYGVYSIASNGEIYPCLKTHHFGDYKLGDVYSGINSKKKEIWKNNPISLKKDCQECWAKYLCGGGCRAYSIEDHHCMDKNVEYMCEINKIIIENSIILFNKLFLKE